MAAAAPAIGIVTAVSGIAQRNADVSRARYAARLQQEANARSERIQLLDLERQIQQNRYAADLERQQTVAQAQLLQMQNAITEIEERVNIAQQLGSINFDDAQAQLVAAAQQYVALQGKFQADQAISEQRLERTQQQGAAYQQMGQQNSRIREALASGNLKQAQLLSQTMAASDQQIGVTGAVDDSAIRRQEETEVASALQANQAQAEYLAIDADRAAAFENLLYGINKAQLTSDLAASNLLQAEAAAQAATGRQNLADYGVEVSKIASLGREGIDLAKQSSLLQTQINQGYAESAMNNAKLGVRTNTAAQNAQIQGSIPTRGIFGGLVNVAAASIPLISGYMNRSNQAQQIGPYRSSGVSVGLWNPVAPPTNPFRNMNMPSNVVLKPVDFTKPL